MPDNLFPEGEYRKTTDPDGNDRHQFRGNRGCAIVVVSWLVLMALACLGWFGGQVYQVWTG